MLHVASLSKTTGGRNDPVTLMLDERGKISDCSQSAEGLFGYHRNDLLGLHVSRLFPQLLDSILFQERRFNAALKFLCRCGHHFQSQDRLGNTFPSALNFVQLNCDEKNALRLMVLPQEK